ncbi:right-handed parallel beta-helix repeat-containing protein [Herbidospora mongoliensis]|uniref:right-handed parallel beta-helix repeat-containing protein n=1 Tax=Herbidospora mongoliensis TaxID=688067 RepID=UPI0012F848AA|nr:right-handed parallel beta-helix repeat-containing protein [Herbidospora mongoliensis]
MSRIVATAGALLLCSLTVGVMPAAAAPSPSATPSARASAGTSVKPSATPSATGRTRGQTGITDTIPSKAPRPAATPAATGAAPSAAPSDAPSIPSSEPAPLIQVSAEDAEAQSLLVDMEDQRILQTRAALTALLQTGGIAAAQRKAPQIFSSTFGRTMVLPSRNDGKPYTLKDLQKVENGKYVRLMTDGSYLLGIHLFVADGATLQLRGPMTLRMGSIPGSFSSIVTFGGNIDIKGTATKPVRITSWDVKASRPDLDTTDGRAYLRAVGGAFDMVYGQVSDLGFWSGRTGGIALTGTERPSSTYRHRTKTQRHEDKADRLDRNTEEPGGGSYGDVETYPVGPGTASHVPADELVTGKIANSVITRDAYGLFVSGSNQTQILNNKIRDSIVHGVFMHRFAKNATISKTEVTGSGGDGFVLSRATEKVQVNDCLAEGNGRNGFTLDGRALAHGPSASGESLAVYGDSSVNNSTARDNGRYGIEVLGGIRQAVQTSEVVGGEMGIVVRAGADSVQLSGNKLTGQTRQGIALRDGVKNAHVSGNTITGGPTGVYLRDSNGRVVGNKITTLKDPNAHGVTLVGLADGSEIARNTIVGSGTSAVSSARSTGNVNDHNNNEEQWVDTSTFWSKAKRYVKPMNVIWAGVILLILVSALRSRGVMDRRRKRIIDPYELQQAMEERPSWTLSNPATASPGGGFNGRTRPTQPAVPTVTVGGGR